MSHRPRVPEGIQPFLEKNDLLKKAKGWKSAVSESEPATKNGNPITYRYNAHRTENSTDKMRDIEILHKESFIRKVIPGILAKLKPGEKLKIFDNGAGTGLFTDQLRSNPDFGSQIEVYSTGLSKRAAKIDRELDPNTSQMHKNDLKWRSIQELSNFPEFNIIIDTFGEQYYRSNQGDPDWDLKAENIQELYLHVSQVIAKLKIPGYASLAPIYFGSEELAEAFVNKIKNDFNLNCHWAGSEKRCLKIEKF